MIVKKRKKKMITGSWIENDDEKSKNGSHDRLRVERLKTMLTSNPSVVTGEFLIVMQTSFVTSTVKT